MAVRSEGPPDRGLESKLNVGLVVVVAVIAAVGVAIWMRGRDERTLDRVIDQLDEATLHRELLDAMVELDRLVGDTPTLWSATYLEVIAGTARMRGRPDIAAVVTEFARARPLGTKVELGLLDDDPESSIDQLGRWRDQGWSLAAFGTEQEPRVVLLIGSATAEAPNTGRFPPVSDAEIEAGFRALAEQNPKFQLVEYWCEGCGDGPSPGVEMPGVFSADVHCLRCGADMVARPAPEENT